MEDGNRIASSDFPTKVITQARRLRALLPPSIPDQGRAVAEDPEATMRLSFGPETIPPRRLGLQPGTGRSAIPLNARSYDLPAEVAAYRNGYGDGFIDAVTIRSAQP